MAVANPYKKAPSRSPTPRVSCEFVLLVDALDRQDAEARGDFAA